MGTFLRHSVVFGVRSGFISKSVHARLQVICRIYYLLRQNLLQSHVNKTIVQDQDQDPMTTALQGSVAKCLR